MLHENYDSFTVENDICLLELESAATMSDTVATIALPSNHEEYEAGTMCTVTGWGAVSEGGHLANKLQKVDQFIFDVILKTEHDSPSAFMLTFFIFC